MVYIGQIRRAPDGTEVVVESIDDWAEQREEEERRALR